MRLLLNIQKQFNEQGRDVELITVDELHAVRHEWLNDPNEPDWDDSLPSIVFDILGIKLDWTIDDSNQFSFTESQLLHDIAPKHGVSPQMVKKLIDVEKQMSGLARRTGIFNRIGRLIQQDWESAETIIASNLDIRQKQMRQSNEVKTLEDELKQINAMLKAEGIE